MEAQKDPSFKEILNSADLVVPDGMPLVWIGRRRGFKNLKRRVYGPELMETFLRETGPKYRHFLYGAAPETLDKLQALVFERFQTNIVGAISPPFRILTPDEDKEIVAEINDSNPDFIWVGLSTPKQERWMFEHRDSIDPAVMLGVGAAFDFLTGTKRKAPSWMQEHGLEWLFRLVTEPRRLAYRYLVLGSQFVILVLREEWDISRARRRHSV
ncbi:MAG: WecB/TagA/CpsF family glycosyltransferase [Actinomycetota bacterium]|nr:WecB/TagA/CpsF family glycosyltransferase [Actinomycetota bacterium]